MFVAVTTGRLIKYIARDMIGIESHTNGEHVMNDTFEMNQGLGHQLEMAFARNGWTKPMVNKATEGSFLSGVLDVLEGRARITYTQPVSVSKNVSLETDRFGRMTFTVKGVGLPAREMEPLLKGAGHEFSRWAKDVLSQPDYDRNHRLEADREYKVVLVLGKEIRKDGDRTTKALKALAVKDYGPESVSGLKGELALLIRLAFSNAELEQMGLWYIAVLHEPIVDSDGDPDVLGSSRSDGSFVGADYGSPIDLWDDDGAFAFLAH